MAKAKYYKKRDCDRDSKRYRMCIRKRKYDLRGAHEAVARVEARTKKSHRVYKCPYCRAYHITHTLRSDDDY